MCLCYHHNILPLFNDSCNQAGLCTTENVTVRQTFQSTCLKPEMHLILCWWSFLWNDTPLKWRVNLLWEWRTLLLRKKTYFFNCYSAWNCYLSILVAFWLSILSSVNIANKYFHFRDRSSKLRSNVPTSKKKKKKRKPVTCNTTLSSCWGNICVEISKFPFYVYIF